MTGAQNRELLERIFARLEQGDGSLLVESLAEDFSWTVIGTTSWSGTYRGRDAVLRDLLGPLLNRFADRYTNTARRFVAEGDHVVVECRGRVTTKEGLRYDNTYCWVCRVTDRRLRELTEYCDTELIANVLGERVTGGARPDQRDH